MATRSGLAAPPIAVQMDTRSAARPRLASARFDWLATGLAGAVVAGGHVDGWAHTNERAETFFTPYHALLYAALVANLAFLLAASPPARGLRDRYRAAPLGYGLSLLGVAVFAAGGVADLIWHQVYGVESDFAALVGSSHLPLFAGAFLIVTGPLRSGWAHVRQGALAEGWIARGPMILSAAWLLALCNFVATFFHPFGVTLAVDPPPSRVIGAHYQQALGVAGFILEGALVTGVLLMLLAGSGWRLPAGAAFVVIALPVTMAALTRGSSLGTSGWATIAVGVAGGLAAEAFIRLLRPAPARPARVWAVGLLVPAALFAFDMAALGLTGDVWWPVHVWTGAVFFGGVAGLLVAFLLAPPWPHAATAGHDP